MPDDIHITLTVGRNTVRFTSFFSVKGSQLFSGDLGAAARASKVPLCKKTYKYQNLYVVIFDFSCI
jgi:hypothetical protein